MAAKFLLRDRVNVANSVRETNDVDVVEEREQKVTRAQLFLCAAQRGVLGEAEEEGHQKLPVRPPRPVECRSHPQLHLFFLKKKTLIVARRTFLPAIFNAQQSTQHRVSRHKVESTDPIDGGNTGAGVRIGKMLQNMGDAIGPGSGLQCILKGSSGRLHLICNLLSDCSCNEASQHISNYDASQPSVKLPKCGETTKSQK